MRYARWAILIKSTGMPVAQMINGQLAIFETEEQAKSAYNNFGNSDVHEIANVAVVTETPDRHYYLVQKVGGGPATYKHPDYSSAQIEATRLAKEIGGTYIVLKAVTEVINMGVKIDWLGNDEVPF